MPFTLTCYQCGHKKKSRANSVKAIKFKCSKCGSASFRWEGYGMEKRRKK